MSNVSASCGPRSVVTFIILQPVPFPIGVKVEKQGSILFALIDDVHAMLTKRKLYDFSE